MGRMDARAQDMTTRQQISNTVRATLTVFINNSSLKI
jgi:hypothetical protein